MARTARKEKGTEEKGGRQWRERERRRRDDILVNESRAFHCQEANQGTYDYDKCHRNLFSTKIGGFSS